MTVDKLPGALWVQALSVRLFGLHLWAINLPQAVEGALTVPFLYRAVRRLSGPRAAICAAFVGAVTPAVVALDRGNVSDSLLLFMLVVALDATSASLVSGSLTSAVLAGLFVGLAFQAKMLEAWLVLPGILGALVLAAPGTVRRRVVQAGALLLVAVVVSLSWMTIVSAIPGHDRPYVDGTTNDSVYTQVFEYNGLGRSEQLPAVGRGRLHRGPCRHPRRGEPRPTGDLGRRGTRRAAISCLSPAFPCSPGSSITRRRPRTDPLRAACVLWGCWLLVDVAAFLTVDTINAYYLAALAPATGALVGVGVELVASRSAERRHPPMPALLVGLAAASVGYAFWLLAPAPLPVRVVALAVAAGIAALARAPTSMDAPALAGGGDGGANGRRNRGRRPARRTLRHPLRAGRDPTAHRSRRRPARRLLGPTPPTCSRSVPAPATSRPPTPRRWPRRSFTRRAMEILPIGGFDGRTPVPSVATLRADVASGALHTVILVPTRDPRVSWVVDHCRIVPTDVRIVRTYYCGTLP